LNPERLNKFKQVRYNEILLFRQYFAENKDIVELGVYMIIVLSVKRMNSKLKE